MKQCRMTKNALGLLLGSLCCSLVCASAADTGRELTDRHPRNIVLIMADDQGYGETGYYGHPHVKTPVLDSMAAQGLRFDRFYAGHCSCSPTRAGIMTGRHPNRSGTFAPNFSTRPEEIFLPKLLQQAGFATGHFGKWHVGAVKAASPLNPGKCGFDEYLSHDNFFELDPPLSHNGAAPEIHRGESSHIVAAAASDFVRKACAAKKRFFAVLWFGSPHQPHRGLPEDVALYGKVASEDLRHRYAEITALDRAVGEFRATLKQLDVADSTLVWYMSDNGIPIVPTAPDSFNYGWRGKKGNLYEGGIRVPAIIEWPAAISKHRVSDVACVGSDILPTLLDLAGVAYPASDRPLDGISLKPLILDNALASRPKPIGFWKYDARHEAQNGRWLDADLMRGTTPTTVQPNINFTNFKHPVARTNNFGGDSVWMENRYKLVSQYNTSGEVAELYDLQNDPHENNDLSAQQPAIVQRMKEQLHEWQQSVERSLSGADYGHKYAAGSGPASSDSTRKKNKNKN